MPIRWIVIYTTVLHLTWAAVLLFLLPVRTTSLGLLLDLCGGSALLAGIVLVLSSVMAVANMSVRTRLRSALLLPQFVIVLLASVSAITAMLLGHFADGVIRPHGFIVADQSYAAILVLMYTLAFIVSLHQR